MVTKLIPLSSTFKIQFYNPSISTMSAKINIPFTYNKIIPKLQSFSWLLLIDMSKINTLKKCNSMTPGGAEVVSIT